MLGEGGVTSMEARVTAVTVRVAEPDIPPYVAMMEVVPTPTPVVNPCDPEAFEMLATEGLTLVHLTLLVKFRVVLSL